MLFLFRLHHHRNARVVTDMVKVAKDAYKGSTSDKADSTKILLRAGAVCTCSFLCRQRQPDLRPEIRQLCIKGSGTETCAIAGKELKVMSLKAKS